MNVQPENQNFSRRYQKTLRCPPKSTQIGISSVGDRALYSLSMRPGRQELQSLFPNRLFRSTTDLTAHRALAILLEAFHLNFFGTNCAVLS